MKGLKGKNVLVTGASTGIGRAIAVRFAQEGANVAINYYSGEEEARQTQALIDQACEQIQGCGVKDQVIQADVSQPDDVANMFEQTLASFGDLDILVNNAGIQMQGPSHEIDLDKFDRMLGVNLKGAYLCARRAIQHFLAQAKPGVIINNSSVHEIIPRPQYVGYSISKGGLENMTRTLALEYAPQGIRINSIGPGATATPINDWANNVDERARVESHIPMRRVGNPEEMAAAVAFLASDEASYITGQTLFIDGGLTLYPDFLKPWS
ncbi:glucose 1-dehydrogenase [Almyronema epifaneia]|uniref:Glucose 1-dehydrogenase n=1 Tax=Almyronema epifaneia S1 TaxID=2991925 RepID=A0ABW6IAN9_9CYAN